MNSINYLLINIKTFKPIGRVIGKGEAEGHRHITVKKTNGAWIYRPIEDGYSDNYRVLETATGEMISLGAFYGL